MIVTINDSKYLRIQLKQMEMGDCHYYERREGVSHGPTL
jgi:hypothetical protein